MAPLRSGTNFRARRLVGALSLAGVSWGCGSGCSALLRSDDATFAQAADAAMDSNDNGGDARLCDRIPEPRLHADTPLKGALLGAAMAADGDVLVATAPFEPEDGTESTVTRTSNCATNLKQIPSHGVGRAYVFEKTKSGWREQRLDIAGRDLVDAQVPEGAIHGLPDNGIYPTYSVAVSGNTIAFGVGGDGSKAAYRGSVRLFHREAGEWTEAAQPIEEPTSRARDLFGMSVAMDGSSLVVGAPSEDRSLDGGVLDGPAGDGGDTIEDGGAAYVYDLDDTGATHAVRLVPNTRIPRAFFGYSVAVSPDWIVVGAPGEDPTGTRELQGNVYAYRRTATGIEKVPDALKTDDPRTMGTFGSALAIRGSTLIVAALASDGCDPDAQPATMPGALHVFKWIDNHWKWQQCLDGSRTPYSAFGYSMALGAQRLLVGAPLETLGSDLIWAGTVHEYRLSHDLFEEEPCVIRAGSPMACGTFGLSLAVADSFAAVGAAYEGSDADSTRPLDSGGIYTYRTNDAP
jgi:hypothetical protein